MNIDLIPIGDDPPNTVNVIIEVPVGGEPVKYEFDKKSGALFVDRILHTPMRYPANYGFIPHTLSPDGDPIDAMVHRALTPRQVGTSRSSPDSASACGECGRRTKPRLLVEFVLHRLAANRDFNDHVDSVGGSSPMGMRSMFMAGVRRSLNTASPKNNPQQLPPLEPRA